MRAFVNLSPLERRASSCFDDRPRAGFRRRGGPVSTGVSSRGPPGTFAADAGPGPLDRPTGSFRPVGRPADGFSRAGEVMGGTEEIPSRGYRGSPLVLARPRPEGAGRALALSVRSAPGGPGSGGDRPARSPSDSP